MAAEVGGAETGSRSGKVLSTESKRGGSVFEVPTLPSRMRQRCLKETSKASDKETKKWR